MAINEDILTGYPKSQDYINTGSGFNTGDGDSIRESYTKTNDGLRKLDQEKANLNDVEFGGTVKGPNVIITGEKDLYITLKDIENYLKNEAEGDLLLISPKIEGTTSVINQLDDSEQYSVVITKNDLDNFIADYAPLDSPTFTGSQPKWNDGSKDLTLATENFISGELDSKADKNSPIFTGSQPSWNNGNTTRNLVVLDDVVSFVENSDSELNISSNNISFDTEINLSNGAVMPNALEESPNNNSSLITIEDLDTWFSGEEGALDTELENKYGLKKDTNNVSNPIILDNSIDLVIRDEGGELSLKQETGLFSRLLANGDERPFVIQNESGGSLDLVTTNNKLSVPSSSDGNIFYNDKEIPTAERVSELVEIADFYDVPPKGHRIYVSSVYGNDWNYGFTPQTSVKSIKQAAINAYALQAPNTLDGNLRKDAYRVLEWNRELIVEEIGLTAVNNPFICPTRSAKTYRDVDDIYGAISKDLLLDTNRNLRLVAQELIDVGNEINPTVPTAWNTTININGNDTTLFNYLVNLMSSVLYSEDSNSDKKPDPDANDFPETKSRYGIEYVKNKLTFSKRSDNNTKTEALFTTSTSQLPDIENIQSTLTELEQLGETDNELYQDLQIQLNNAQQQIEILNESTEEPCTYLRQQLLNLSFPTSEDNIDEELPYKTPNQGNTNAYSVIRVESGTYKERFPIELPDGVSMFGDSLRRVNIMPTDDIKEKGCGLHQRFLTNTFTNLSIDNETWEASILIDYPKSGSARPAVDTLFDIGSNLTEIKENIAGNRYTIAGFSSSEVKRAEFIGSGVNTLLKLVFEAPAYGIDQLIPNQPFNFEEAPGEIYTLQESDLLFGYLLLRSSENDEPLRLTGGQFERGARLTPTFKFNNGTPKFKLRKGDVLAIVDITNSRRELIRVERHKEINNQGDLANFFLSVPHRLNERLNFEGAYVYIAPRAEWQTLCEQRTFERGFSNANNSYPSTEVVTNTAEVGQNAVHVGNANYIFQVVYKEHTNFSYAFRRDRPRVFASPYVQNCSSITTKGGGGILVDGFIPRQPDEDFPQPLLELNVPDDIFSEWDSKDSGETDINRAVNMHYDGKAILEEEQDNILSVFDENPVKSTLQDLKNKDVNYGSIEKCKEDARFILNAVKEQMLRGGNDKVFDTAKVIETVIFNQVKNTEIPLQSFNRIMQAYAQVIGKLEEKAAFYIENGSDNLDVKNGNCKGVAATVHTLFDVIRRVLNGNPSAKRYYDGAFALLTDLDEGDNSTLMSLFDSSSVQDALSQLGQDTNYDGQLDKCKRDLRFIVAAIEWHLPRGGNNKVVEIASTIHEAVSKQDNGDPNNLNNDIRDAYEVVLNELKSRLDTVIKNEPFNGSVQNGNCQDVVDTAQSYVDDMIEIIVNSGSITKTFKNEITRNNSVATPGVEMNKSQNAELRSFVLDAFTQINTLGGWGHLIRNNGYAQLVSTFTTFCDHGVKVESGGLINLSNSVSDFGFFGLLADGRSETSYLSGNLFESVRGALPGSTPSSEIYIDPLTLVFNQNNPVYKERFQSELSELIADYNAELGIFESELEAGNEPFNSRDRLENLRKRIEELAVESIQFNTSLLFEEGENEEKYNFRRDNEHLESDRQIPRNLAYVDRPDEVSKFALTSYKNTNATDIPDITEELMIRKPSIRVGFPVNQRVPNATETGFEKTPILEEGTRVDFYITTTLTSSAHGFEYVGSGNDYSNALPENGGVPDASKQLLETNGGKVFTSSTDVRGDFRVGNFFTVKQSTGAVSFNPSSLELVNISSIGPFRSQGIVGNNVIKDLTDDFNRLIPGSGDQGDSSTIATVNSIKDALNDTFISLSSRVSSALLRSESNAKLLEAVQNPIPDFGSWAVKHSIFHREYQLLDQNDNFIEGFDRDSKWTIVRDFESYLYELGAKVNNETQDLTTNEFRNRSSYTLNFVIDTSESMSRSGKFWRIKQDLISFLYNFDERDSFALYTFSDSVVNQLYITVEGSRLIEVIKEEFQENNKEKITLETFHPNTESNSLVGYIIEPQNKNWYNVGDDNNNAGITFNDTNYYKIGEGELYSVNDIIEEGNVKKIRLSNVAGLINSGLLIRIKDENDILVLNPGEESNECPEGYDCLAEDEVEFIEQDEDCPEGFVCFTRTNIPDPEILQSGDFETRDIIKTVEYGLLPKIFNSSIGTDNIRRAFNNFDFNSTIRNSILREVGVVLPDTSRVNNDFILENQVWGALDQAGYNTGILNERSKPSIAPGPIDFENPNNGSDNIWVNGESDINAFNKLDPSYDLSNDDNREVSKWFYADVDPLADGVSVNVFDYLPPRSAVSGKNATEYKIGDLQTFGRYDPDNNPNGFLTAEDFTNNQFLKETKSTPLLDVALVVHSTHFPYSAARTQASAMRGLMNDLKEAGTFDWKVAKLSARGGVNTSVRIRDFYLNDVSEPPREEIFKDDGGEFRWGNDRNIVSGVDQRRIALESLEFTTNNNDNEPDLANLQGNTNGLGTPNEFWIKLPSINAPIHKGTNLTLSNRDSTISVPFDLPFGTPINEISIDNSKENLEPGDEITISLGSDNDVKNPHYYNFAFKVTVDGSVGINESTTVPIQESNNGLQDLIASQVSNPNGELHDGTGRNNYPGYDFTLTSGDLHPLFNYVLPKGKKEAENDNGELIIEEYDIDYRFPGYEHRGTVSSTSLDVKVKDVLYPTSNFDNELYIKVSVEGSWTTGTGAVKAIGTTGTDLFINNQFETLYTKGDNTGSAENNQSTMKRISDACIELNWRPNSFKVMAVMSRTPNSKEFPYWGGYYYAQNCGLSLANRVLLRRFDYLFTKYRNSNVNELFEGQAIEAAFNALESDDDTLVQPREETFYNDSDFISFIDSFSELLRSNGGLVHAWYLGNTNDANGDIISEVNSEGFEITAERGSVNRAGRIIFDTVGNAYTPGNYASYLAPQEDLLFADIKQLHIATRGTIYHRPNDINLFNNVEDSVDEVDAFGGLLSIHNVTNFNENTVNAITNHRAGIRKYDQIDLTNKNTGNGYDFDSDSTLNTFFTDQWENKRALLPKGQWRNLWDVLYSNWLKNLSVDIINAQGEGQEVLYTEFGNDSGDISSENIARFNDENNTGMPPGYRELISDPVTFNTTVDGETIGYIDKNNNLVKNPTPSILPSPSIGKDLLINASNSSPVPGFTLKGKSAVYETFAIATKDASVQPGENLLDNDPRTSIEPRNPARNGTVNINAIISDGNDNASFEDLIIKHFINYDTEGRVNINSTIKNLFYELFMDDGGNIQLQNGVPVQRKHIYTSEVINTLHIISYALAGEQELNEVRVDTGTGFGGDNSPYDLPIEVFSNDNFDDTTQLFNKPGANNIVRMVRDITTPVVDNMGLIPPFYRGSRDAYPCLVAAERIQNTGNLSSLNNNDTFPNPYRFSAYAFSANLSKQFRGDNEIPESSQVFTNLGEVGPSITFELNISPLGLDENMIYNNDNQFNDEEQQVRLPERVQVRIFSKLGYLHSITPDIRDQGIASQIVVFDPGFEQNTSKASQILAQNLGGVDGTAFRQPGQIVNKELREGDFVNRNAFGFPTYRQNVNASLVDQRINYIENAFKSVAKKSEFTSGVPLVSRRYVGTQINGEYFGNIQNIQDSLYLTRVDDNKNNRDAILNFQEDSKGNYLWEQVAGVELGTGGNNQEIIKFKLINFEGSDKPTTILRDYEGSDSKILVLNNNIWQTIIDANTIIYDPLKDPELNNPKSLNLQYGEYFSEIVQTTDSDSNVYTHISISFDGGGFTISTSNSLTSLSIITNSVTWLISHHQPDVEVNTENELHLKTIELNEGDFNEDTIYALYDTSTDFDPQSDTIGPLAGYYVFDFDVKLSRENYILGNLTMDPDPNDPNFNPFSEYYLTLNASRNTPTSITEPFLEVPNFNEFNIQNEPPNTGQGSDQYIRTVIGHPDVAQNEEEEEAQNSGIYVALKNSGNPIELESESRWNNLTRLRNDGNLKPGKGAFRKLTLFENSNTVGNNTVVNELTLEVSQNLGKVIRIPVENNNDHVGVLKYDTVEPNNNAFFIADSIGLTTAPPTSTWALLHKGFVNNNFGFPTAETNHNVKLLDYFTMENFLVIAFGDETRARAQGNGVILPGAGNKIAIMPLPIPDFSQDGVTADVVLWPFSDLNLVTMRDNQKSATSETPDEYYIDCFYGDNSNDFFTVDGHLLAPNVRYISRYVIDSTGVNNSSYVLMFRLEETFDEDDNFTGVQLSTGDGPLPSGVDEADFTVGENVYKFVNVSSIEDIKLNGVSFFDGKYYFSFASLASNESKIIARDPDDHTIYSIENQNSITYNNSDEIESTTNIPLRPMTDPKVTPKFPHGENWIRDGAIGVNEGVFVSEPDAPVDKNFSWNAQRYLSDLLYANVRDTITNYQSSI